MYILYIYYNIIHVYIWTVNAFFNAKYLIHISCLVTSNKCTHSNVQAAEAAELHVGSIVLTNRITDKVLLNRIINNGQNHITCSSSRDCMRCGSNKCTHSTMYRVLRQLN